MTEASVGQREGALAGLLSSKRFEYSITGLILVNALLLGLETLPSVGGAFGRELDLLTDVILGVFVVELLLRMTVFGRRFWRDGWSWFDMLVVGVGLLPFSEGLAAMRALRVFRLLRIVSVVPSLRHVVEGLLRALPGLGSIVMLLLVLIYVFSVMATKLFGESNPELFGSLGASAFSLFTVMTLEGWPDLARTVMEEHPWAWLFFIVFILMSSWAVLNLFIGVIVDAMQSEEFKPEAREPAGPAAQSDAVMLELEALQREMRRIREALDARRG